MRQKFQFVYTKSQRGALIVLLGLLLILGSTINWVKKKQFSDVNLIGQSSVLQKRLDSLLEQDNLKTQPYTYNPNFLSDYRAYSLGIPLEAYDKLVQFRASGSFVNSMSDFQKITGVSDSLLAVLHSKFRYPKLHFASKKTAPLPKQDLNTVTAESLEKIRGIGPTLSKRIIKYRDYLSGFSSASQCYEVFGLDSIVVGRLLNRFEIQSPPSIQKLDINQATLWELKKTPYITESDARKIISYRTENNRITVAILSELFVNYPNKIARIKLYLH